MSKKCSLSVHAEVTAYAANADAIRFYGRGGFTAMTVTLRQSL
ncbi:hypothetical protein GCM10010276_35420 [Streptomyces longisporus]|uniref:Acetyltransferase n=1 Tax=Streptomyces longisporus TaxID=1948 RepID=A0ABN3LYB3_STRLO